MVIILFGSCLQRPSSQWIEFTYHDILLISQFCLQTVKADIFKPSCHIVYYVLEPK